MKQTQSFFKTLQEMSPNVAGQFGLSQTCRSGKPYRSNDMAANRETESSTDVAQAESGGEIGSESEIVVEGEVVKLARPKPCPKSILEKSAQERLKDLTQVPSSAQEARLKAEEKRLRKKWGLYAKLQDIYKLAALQTTMEGKLSFMFRTRHPLGETNLGMAGTLQIRCCSSVNCSALVQE